jgi:hypothetical protein
MKSETQMTEIQKKYFQMTLDAVTRKLRFDTEYDFSREGEDEAEFMEFRYAFLSETYKYQLFTE